MMSMQNFSVIGQVNVGQIEIARFEEFSQNK